MSIHPTVEAVTQRIILRSRATRDRYLEQIAQAAEEQPLRSNLGCSNLAHGTAACAAPDKSRLNDPHCSNIGIITAYNDMLSAHKPYESFPELIRKAAQQAGGVAQVAGGVPAMCDGITQGRSGMELSLFSRDVIAMATAVGLSHDIFDAALLLGICDKIVPGLLIGALSFGHIPTAFVPAGPMPSGLSNKEKATAREAYASGNASRSDLLAAESAAYHAPGTCTFYGTANTNQMLLEFMGLQLPGSSFEPPESELRPALTRAITQRMLKITRHESSYLPVGELVNEKSLVNGIVGLLATGGSTNHTLHVIAIAAAAGIRITFDDFADLANVVPLLASVYPNGTADVNAFHQCGGLGWTMQELLHNDLLHSDVRTVVGDGLHHYTHAPTQGEGDALNWQTIPPTSPDHSVLRPCAAPFQKDGGLRMVTGNLGEGVIKVSAVDEKFRAIAAPAKVFTSQAALTQAYEAGELYTDFVAVVTHQGPSMNGMPELHKLNPILGALQSAGHRVALVTDGRMSGASGKVLSAIHVSPEAQLGGPLAKVRDGDMISIDSEQSRLHVEADLSEREVTRSQSASQSNGRALFDLFRNHVGTAAQGASVFAVAGSDTA